jgi:transposase
LIIKGEPVPNKTILEIAADEQAEMLKELRAARYGYLLGLQILLLCASGKTPTEIAEFLFCSRSSVYRTVAAYRCGEWKPVWQSSEEDGLMKPPRLSWQSRIISLLKKTPQAFGWCRTRWSCLTIVLQLKAERGVSVSRETIRCTLHKLGYVYKRARHVALDNDSKRVWKLARIRSIAENLLPTEALFFADELDINLLSKLGYQWMRRGTQTEVMTPGQNEKAYLAGAWNYVTGKVLSIVGQSKNRWLFIKLLEVINRACPVNRISKIYVVVDNYKIHKAKAVVEWLAKHPRFELVPLPNYCPKANPIERIFGDVHDNCTRNHKRKRLSDLVSDCVWYLKSRGKWRYKLSEIYYEEAVTDAVKKIEKGEFLQAA